MPYRYELTCLKLAELDTAEAIDSMAVSVFSDCMRRKMKEKRCDGKYGWYLEDCTIEFLEKQLIDHVEIMNIASSQMVDIANLAMMIEIKKSMGHK